MRHLHKLGATAFDDQYTILNVSSYLLSILIKTRSVDPKELSEVLGTSLRTAQRYAYNSHNKSKPCLTNIYNCLVFIKYPIGDFFREVEEFLNNESQIALYDLKENKLTHYTEVEYLNLNLCQDDLNRIIKQRAYIVEKCGFTFVRPYLPELDNAISRYPIHMIIGR